MREGAQGGLGEKGTQPGNGVWLFSFRLSYRRSEKKPARPPAGSGEANKRRCTEAGGRGGGAARRLGKKALALLLLPGNWTPAAPARPAPPPGGSAEGEGGRHRHRAPRAPHLARKRSCKAKGGVQPGPVLSRILGASPLRKMRGKNRKESLSDSRDLDGSYDQLTGEFPPSWQFVLLRAAALA